MSRGTRPALAALFVAGALADGCSRTGLDDDVLLGPQMTGAPNPDAAVSAQDDAAPPATSSSGGGEGSSSSGGSESSSSGSDGGEFFTSTLPDAADLEPDGSGGDGQGSACSPANCLGCCNASGFCGSGLATSACGNHGQRCMVCEAERSCNSVGSCE